LHSNYSFRPRFIVSRARGCHVLHSSGIGFVIYDLLGCLSFIHHPVCCCCHCHSLYGMDLWADLGSRCY
jgi:hypothetical protein